MAVKFFIFFGFILVALLLFSSVIHSFFLSDDFVFIDTAKFEKKPFKLWVTPLFIRPIIMLSFFLDHQAWGLSASGYHLTNILVHAVNSFLVFLVCLSLLKLFQAREEERNRISLLAGVLFLVFAGHSESIAWISGRTDVFATLFLLVSFWCYLRYRQNRNIAAVLFSYVFFILALLSKESVIVYPLIVFAFDFFLPREEDRRPRIIKVLSIRIGSFFFILAGYFVFRFLVLGSFLKISGDFQTNIWVVFSNLMFSLSRSVFPFQLLKGLWNTLTSFDVGVGEFLFKLLIFVFLFGGLLAIMIKAKKKQRGFVLFVACASFLSIVPILNWMVSISDTQNERFLYLPSVFVSLLMVLGIEIIFKRKFVRAVLFSLLLLGHTVFLFQSNSNWKAAGTVSKGILFSFIKHVAELPPDTTDKIFILNLPDSLNGAYVSRNGFFESLHLFEQDVYKKVIVGISSHTLKHREDTVRVELIEESTYSLELLREDVFFLQSPPSSRDFYEVFDFNRNAFKVKFSSFYGNLSLYSFSMGKINKVDFVKGEKNLPFGLIHPLKNDSFPGSKDIFLSGVVVGDREIQKIEVKRDPFPSDPESSVDSDGLVGLSEVLCKEGKDPSLASLYPNYPFKFSLLFQHFVSADELPEHQTEPVRIYVIVYDHKGERIEIGTTVIKIQRPPK